MKKKSETLESNTKQQIIDVLKACGIYHWKAWQGPMSTKGISDILGILRPSGRFFAIEVKRVGREPTDNQKWFLQNVEENGGIAIVAYCVEDIMLPLGIKAEVK